MIKPIVVQEISKSYGAIEAVRDLSFEVEQGELFGLIGADGAGKTTLMRILITLLLADKGKAYIQGMDVVDDYKAIRKIIGYMPGRFSLYHDLSVEENLNFFASIFNTTVKENYHLIKDIYSHIEPFKTRPAGKLSGGMKQKLALSCALIHKPDILVLDEPTTGVDAVSRREFWDMLKKLKTMGVTILVSTPYMDEAGQCDRVALIQSGSILAIETPEAITQLFGRRLFAVRAANMFTLITSIEHLPGLKFTLAGQFINVYDEADRYNSETLLSLITAAGNTGVSITEVQPTIEDCFIKLMTKKPAA